MSMTKTDYERVQEVFHDKIDNLNYYYPYHKSERTDERKSSDTALNNLIQTARALAWAFEKDDPKFDRIRFLVGCGMQEHQLKRYSEKTTN